MSDTFDPYQQWLAVPPSEQPPDHYRLLGLKRFETNRGNISRAVRGRIDHVRKLGADRRPELVEKIIKELSAARHCLLTPRLREPYDAELSKTLETEPAEANGADPNVGPTIVVHGPSPMAAAQPAAPRKTRRWTIVAAAIGGAMTIVVLAMFFVGDDSSDEQHPPGRDWRPQGPKTLADLMNKTNDSDFDVNTVGGMLQAARMSMAGGDYETTAHHLEAANAAATPAERAEIKRVETLLESIREFWSAVEAEVETLDVDDTIVSGKTTLTVIRAEDSELQLKGPQKSYRYSTDDLPAKLAVVLAARHLSSEDIALCNLHIGSFHAVDPQGNRQEARRRWQEAGSKGMALLGELE